MSELDESDDLYVVIADCEDALAFWPATCGVPSAWRTIVSGTTRQRCVSFIQDVDAERRADVIRRVFETARVRP